MYRYDEAALRDWSKQIGQSRLQLLPPTVNSQRDAVLRLQVEYLAKCMPAGKVLSLANAVEGQGEGAVAVPGGEEAKFFMVVDKYPARKKLMLGDSGERFGGMAFPSLVQWFDLVNLAGDGGEEGSGGGSGRLCYRGQPEAVDALALAPWTSWRNGLQRHEVEAAPGSKYMQLVSAERIFPVVEDWRSVDCPTLAILDNLANSGWSRGNARRLHTLGGPKKMRQVNDPVKERAYLQCLVGLANLVAEGGR